MAQTGPLCADVPQSNSLTVGVRYIAVAVFWCRLAAPVKKQSIDDTRRDLCECGSVGRSTRSCVCLFSLRPDAASLLEFVGALSGVGRRAGRAPPPGLLASPAIGPAPAL